MILSGETAAKRSGVLRGGKSFHGEQTLTVSHFIADSVGFVTESIMVCKVRQDGFAKFIKGMR